MAVNKPKPLMARQPSATKPKPKNYVPMSQTAPYSGNKPKPMGSGGSKPKPQGYRANTNPPMGAKEKTKPPLAKASRKINSRTPAQQSLRGYYGY